MVAQNNVTHRHLSESRTSEAALVKWELPENASLERHANGKSHTSNPATAGNSAQPFGQLPAVLFRGCLKRSRSPGAQPFRHRTRSGHQARFAGSPDPGQRAPQRLDELFCRHAPAGTRSGPPLRAAVRQTNRWALSTCPTMPPVLAPSWKLVADVIRSFQVSNPRSSAQTSRASSSMNGPYRFSSSVRSAKRGCHSQICSNVAGPADLRVRNSARGLTADLRYFALQDLAEPRVRRDDRW